MPVKVKSVNLSDGWLEPAPYRVERVTETTEYHIGQFLKKSDVEELCCSQNWRVAIVPRAR